MECLIIKFPIESVFPAIGYHKLPLLQCNVQWWPPGEHLSV